MRWRTRDPRVAALAMLLGLGDVVVSQTLMWSPSEAPVDAETAQGIPVIRLGGPPPPELPSPALAASTVAGLILLAGGFGAFVILRLHPDEPAPRAPTDPAALVDVPPAPEDPLAMDPELRELVERHESGLAPRPGQASRG